MKLASFLLACAAILCASCTPTPEQGRANVEDMAKKVTPGMSERDVVKLFGEPQEKVAGEGGRNEKSQDPKKSSLWRYKNKDQYYELWVRFYDGKATWATSYDKSSKLNTG